MKIILKEINQYVIKLDRGEELIESLKKFCKKEKIKAAFFRGLGSANEGALAYYSLSQKKYFTKTFKKTLEILSLIGNISYKDKELAVHAHAVLGNEEMMARGGHLNYLIIGATCEIYLTKFKKQIERKYSKEIGLNLME